MNRTSFFIPPFIRILHWRLHGPERPTSAVAPTSKGYTCASATESAGPATRQESFASGKACITVPSHDGEPEYDLCESTPAVGSCSGHGFVNGAFYNVTNVTKLTLTVTDTLTSGVLECSPEILAKHTCLRHAVVYNRAQGCTIRDEMVILHCLDSKWFRRNHLYVGLSRVTRGSDIRVM